MLGALLTVRSLGAAALSPAVAHGLWVRLSVPSGLGLSDEVDSVRSRCGPLYRDWCVSEWLTRLTRSSDIMYLL